MGEKLEIAQIIFMQLPPWAEEAAAAEDESYPPPPSKAQMQAT